MPIDDYKAWYDEAMVASNTAGYVGMSAAQTITAMDQEIQSLRAQLSQPTVEAQRDVIFLLEAYDNGQFADDMLDHPSPDCRAPIKPVREALRRHLDRLQQQHV